MVDPTAGGQDLAIRAADSPRTPAAGDPASRLSGEAASGHPATSHAAHDETPFVNLRDPARALGPDGRPAQSRRAPIWEDVPDERWND